MKFIKILQEKKLVTSIVMFICIAFSLITKSERMLLIYFLIASVMGVAINSIVWLYERKKV